MGNISIKTIAQQSGYSIATVSRYINKKGYVGEKTKNRIKQVIQELNYTPSLIARSLVTKQSHIIGLIIPNISSPFLANFVEGVEYAAKKERFTIFLCHSHGDPEIERFYLKILSERRVDAIISMPCETNSQVYREISKNTPVVFAIRTLEDATISSISGDDFNGSYTAVKYLIAMGHRRIAFINGVLRYSSGRLRWEGAKAALGEYGIDLDEELVVESNYTFDGGYESAKIILKNPRLPTAIYAANHLSSVGALTVIKESGYRVPMDISVAAFDGFDGTYAERLISPKISANIYPSRIVGEKAVNMVIDDTKRKQQKTTHSKANVIVSQCIKINMVFEERESVRKI